jgi:hypothetical protein
MKKYNRREYHDFFLLEPVVEIKTGKNNICGTRQ